MSPFEGCHSGWIFNLQNTINMVCCVCQLIELIAINFPQLNYKISVRACVRASASRLFGVMVLTEFKNYVIVDVNRTVVVLF